MPYKREREGEEEPLKPDSTPISKYTVELSDRDVGALDGLRSRNGAGIGNIAVENVALWKMINQVCETPKNSIWLKVPEIEHPEWLV